MKFIFISTMIALALAACGPQSAPPAASPETGGSSSTEAEKGCVVDPPAEPFACTMDWRPVCGCDGVTYSNPCHARAAGVPDFSEGECDAEKLD